MSRHAHATRLSEKTEWPGGFGNWGRWQNERGTLNLITPNSLFGPRFTQLDVSINRTTDIGWGKLRLAFDLYNATNSNSVQNVTTAYTTTASANRWLRPTTFLDPRLARVTASIQF